jgi:hypothetical protein
VKHGAYATLLLRPRAAEIAARLRDALGDSFEEKHAPAIETAALAGAQVERAMGVSSPTPTPTPTTGTRSRAKRR